MLSPHTLRAANSGFYLACMFFVVAACFYVLYTKELSLVYMLTLVAACVVAIVWGAYYALFCYRVTAVRISRISLFCTRHIYWQEITGITYEETDSGGVASYKLMITSATHTFEISSALLLPDAVQELASDLRKIGLLMPPELPRKE